jgi:hypothetical protein
MKKLFILLALVVSAGFIQAQDRQAFSLEDAIDYALQNSLEIKNAQLNVADAKEQVVERRAIGLPQISAGANYQYFIDIPTQILPDFITPSVYGVLFQEGLVEPFNLSTGEGVAAQFGTKHNLTAGVDLSTLIFDGSYFIGLKAAKAYKKVFAGGIGIHPHQPTVPGCQRLSANFAYHRKPSTARPKHFQRREATQRNARTLQGRVCGATRCRSFVFIVCQPSNRTRQSGSPAGSSDQRPQIHPGLPYG